MSGRVVRLDPATHKVADALLPWFVNGTLDPYADPQSGQRLLTTFSGELKGNTIEGTYRTRLPSGEMQSGRWTVQRR